jgi:hypothetical protein
MAVNSLSSAVKSWSGEQDGTCLIGDRNACNRPPKPRSINLAEASQRPKKLVDSNMKHKVLAPV